MMLPFGRRLFVYWRSFWHRPAVLRCGHAVLLWCGPVLLVAYTGRISWADLDRQIERAYQKRQRRAR
jgi:hypothetical protein